MFNSKFDLKILFWFNWLALVLMASSYFIIMLDIRSDVQNYGFSYEVTTEIQGVRITENVNVVHKFTFSGIILTIVLINILTLVHFRSRLLEFIEKKPDLST